MSQRTESRLAKLRQKMRASDTQLVVLGPGAHMQWLLGFHTHPDERPCLLLIGEKRETFLMPSLNAEDTQQRCSIECHEWTDADGPHRAMKNALAAVRNGEFSQVVLDETMRADFALLVLDHLPGAGRRFTDDTVGNLRMKKDEQEYRSLKENASIADLAMKKGIASVGSGMSELDVAAIIREEFAQHGADMQFCIVGSGPNGALPHHATGTRTIANGDAVVMDIGGKKGEFSSDITRVAVVGEPSREFKEVHAVVNNAVEAAMGIARPGVKAQEVDQKARAIITQAGFGEYFVHRTGHGLGIEVHEPPYLTSTSETILEAGMVFSIEPGIYLPGKFGVRLEEIVILRDGGPEILSSLSRDYAQV